MIPVMFVFLTLSAVLVVREQSIVRLIIILDIYSLFAFACYLLLSAPDVALAEIVVSVFTTIVFVVAFDKYYATAGRVDYERGPAPKESIARLVLSGFFVAALAFLFYWFMPAQAYDPSLMRQYIDSFRSTIGGINAVTSIYLGYRVYDTLYEALMLLVSIVAVVHLSRHAELSVSQGEGSHISGSTIAVTTIRLISPIIFAICVYLTINGHISPGGGFQGGVVAASMFVCKYLIHDIYDVRIDKIITFEKIIFLVFALLVTAFVIAGLQSYMTDLWIPYLIAMNTLIGLKVTCGFLIIFYRFIALERR